MNADWNDADATDLEAALAPLVEEGSALGYSEAAGFLFAVACAPEEVDVAEWLPALLVDDEDGIQEAAALLARLYEWIDEGVRNRDPFLPAGVAPIEDPLENFGAGAPLGRWSQGYAEGQEWMEETWDVLLPEAAEGEDDPEEVLGSLILVLSFFADREIAEEFHRDSRVPQPFEAFAAEMLEEQADAMFDLALLGRNIAEAEEVAAQGPAQSTKVGRNEPCPCGSGKKYKFCCGAPN